MTKYMTKLMTNWQAINDQNKNDQFWSCNKRPQISHQRSPNQKWSLICGFWSFFWSLISHFPLVLVWMVWGKRQCDWHSMTNSCNRHFHCWTSWRHICHFCRPRTGSQKHEHLSLQKTPYFMWLTDNCRIETKTIHEKFRTH